MTHETARDLLPASMDGELEPSRAGDLTEHMEGCVECRDLMKELEELRADIRESAPYYEAPAALREQIRNSLRRESRPRTLPWNWLATAASLLLAASLAWNFALLRSRKAPETLVAQEIVASHLRSLIGTHLLDVPSTDQHTVKPWFNGKLDFSPDVKDLKSQGFPLVGGRIEYLENRTVAVLVFQRAKHVINLFIWPSAGASTEGELTRSGFNLIHWESGGMTYWAASDLNSGELREFVRLYGR